LIALYTAPPAAAAVAAAAASKPVPIKQVGLETNKHKKPSWCWDSQPSVGIFGIFF